MHKKIFLALVTLLFVPLSLVAQETTTQAPAKQDPVTKTTYATLLERVKKQAPGVNFTDLRMAYTETKEYSPYRGQSEARKKMFASLNAKDYAAALAASEKMLAANYLDLNGHFGASVSNRELGQADKADFHKYVFQGLLDSVNDSGDGKTMETAFVVITTDEEYVWFNVHGLRVESQALIKDKGHNYDKMIATDPKTNETVTFYFNIDKPFNWLGNSFKSKE
jgi:hypothetical protein